MDCTFMKKQAMKKNITTGKNRNVLFLLLDDNNTRGIRPVPIQNVASPRR